MFCPFCKFEETVVKDSRVVEEGSSIRRRRFCNNCDSRFTTYERIHLKEIVVIKKSGEKELFDRNKLFSSLKMSVRKRPVDSVAIENLVNAITNCLNEISESEVSSSHIGELVMEHLKDVDKVAYVRFASVYKNFNDTEDFESFIKGLA